MPCANPNQVPTWGNREETLINIAPTAGAPAGKIAILGGIPVAHIDNGTGLTTPTAVFATNNFPPDPLGRPCPFAGRVTVQGAPLLGYSYKVEVTPSGGGAPIPVVTHLILTRLDGTTFTHTANLLTGRFDYLPFDQNVNSVLAQWDTTGDASWVVKLSTFDGGGNLVATDTHLIQLDNTWPDASITITTGTGDCGKFPVGTLLSGNFVARDDYLGRYSLGIRASREPAGDRDAESGLGSRQYRTRAGRCLEPRYHGHEILRGCDWGSAGDCAIVNSQSVGHHSPDSAAFPSWHPKRVNP